MKKQCFIARRGDKHVQRFRGALEEPGKAAVAGAQERKGN